MIMTIETQRRHGDDLDVEGLEIDACGSGNSLEALTHDMRSVLGGEQQRGAALMGGEAAQAGGAGGDGDGEIEGEERFTALGFTTDDADGLGTPQALDQPRRLAVLERRQVGGAGGRQCGHDLVARRWGVRRLARSCASLRR